MASPARVAAITPATTPIAMPICIQKGDHHDSLGRHEVTCMIVYICKHAWCIKKILWRVPCRRWTALRSIAQPRSCPVKFSNRLQLLNIMTHLSCCPAATTGYWCRCCRRGWSRGLAAMESGGCLRSELSLWQAHPAGKRALVQRRLQGDTAVSKHRRQLVI